MTPQVPNQDGPKRAKKKEAPPPGLRLEWRTPQELAANPKNWRTHPEAQTAALSDALAEVGWAGALLYNEATGRLIDGHARKDVALARGDALVPVLIGTWDEAQEAKILATLDPISAMAQADSAKLADLLRGVSTGSEALQSMLSALAESAGVIPPDATPGGGGDEFVAEPPSGPTRTAVGDLWLIGGRHRLLVGDCTAKENVERLLVGARPFLMVTDPPYGVDYDPKWRDEALPGGARRLGVLANDGNSDWSQAWAHFNGDVAYCWHACWHASSVQDSLLSSGLVIRAQIIWVKDGFAISRGHYHWEHEPCWYAVRNGASARWSGDRSQTTAWRINKKDKEPQSDHGTQKPLECMARPIRNHGSEGDVVYDPFLGSGTTLVAAHRLGRVCYGCEIDPRYADVILRRAEAEGLSCEKK